MFRFSRQQVARTPPPTYLNSDDNRGTIGLAISRPRSEVTPIRQEAQSERKHSRLLPAKPTLTLAIPPQATASGPSSQQQRPTDRASTMTNMTAFADLDTEAAELGQIWRPPPTDPQSATAYYVADPRGNWVLRDDNRKSEVEKVAQAAELDTYTPLTKSPIEKQEEEAAALAGAISATTNFPKKPRPAFLLRDPNNPSMSRSSSLYSQASAVRQRPPPPPARKGSSSSQKGVKPSVSRSDSKDSHASATTINTSSPSPFDDDAAIEDDIARLSQLSPVAESPSPRSGRSRVRYSKITGRLDGATIRHVPPPKRPNFSSSPPGQPSPTLGTVLPAVTGSPSAYPPPLRPKRSNRAPGPAPIQSTGSGFSPAPPPEVAAPQSQQQQFQRPQPRPLQQPSWRPRTPPQQQQQQQQMQSPAPVPAPPRLDTLQAQGRRSPHIASQIVVASPASTTTTTISAASSLLAKRVGGDRAAALALDSNPAGSGKHWRQQQGAGGPGLLSPETAATGLVSPRDPSAGLGSGTLPMTPTWQPKLTPTRRGDDLFLNVQ
ncbi:hypothetical protein DL771_003925 [Monosporascus sp. 5C6A]|nr:hypothetical protein DL771_003925 [Monosporascus sp. 5C6A]